MYPLDLAGLNDYQNTNKLVALTSDSLLLLVLYFSWTCWTCAGLLAGSNFTHAAKKQPLLEITSFEIKRPHFKSNIEEKKKKKKKLRNNSRIISLAGRDVDVNGWDDEMSWTYIGEQETSLCTGNLIWAARTECAQRQTRLRSAGCQQTVCSVCLHAARLQVAERKTRSGQPHVTHSFCIYGRFDGF